MAAADSQVLRDLLRQELEAFHIRLPGLKGISEAEILAELQYALFPTAHEGRTASFGALFVEESGSVRSERVLSREAPADDASRLIADGDRSFVVVRPSSWALEVFSGSLGQDAQFVALGRSRYGVALSIQRDASGVVRV